MAKLFLDGGWTSGARRGQRVLDDPSTGEPIGRVHTAAASQLRAAAISSRATLREGRWPRMPHAYRVGVVRSMLAWIEAHSDRLIEREVAETGSPIQEATRRLTAALDDASAALANTTTSPARVVALVGARLGGIGDVLAAAADTLPSGGTLLLAPTPRFHATAMALAEAALAVDLMPNVLQLLTSEDARELAGSPMLDHLRCVDPTWRRSADLMRAAAAHGTRVDRGPRPCVSVLRADGPLDVAIAALGHGALSRPAVSHAIFVPASRIEDAAQVFAAHAVTARVGVAEDPDTVVGPLAEREDLEAAIAMVARARANGGALVCGGIRVSDEGLPRGGRFLAPTVLIASTVEDIEGPVTTLVPYEDDAQLATMLDARRPGHVLVFGSGDDQELRLASGAPVEAITSADPR